MDIIVNNQVQALATNIQTLAELVADLCLESDAIAIAINQKVVPKTKWPTQILQANDNVAIFSMIAGG